jgi:hypothetical protein
LAFVPSDQTTPHRLLDSQSKDSNNKSSKDGSAKASKEKKSKSDRVLDAKSKAINESSKDRSAKASKEGKSKLDPLRVLDAKSDAKSEASSKKGSEKSSGKKGSAAAASSRAAIDGSLLYFLSSSCLAQTGADGIVWNDEAKRNGEVAMLTGLGMTPLLSGDRINTHLRERLASIR